MPYTQRTTRWTADNVVHMVRDHESRPHTAEGRAFVEETDHLPDTGRTLTFGVTAGNVTDGNHDEVTA